MPKQIIQMTGYQYPYEKMSLCLNTPAQALINLIQKNKSQSEENKILVRQTIQIQQNKFTQIINLANLAKKLSIQNQAIIKLQSILEQSTNPITVNLFYQYIPYNYPFFGKNTTVQNLFNQNLAIQSQQYKLNQMIEKQKQKAINLLYSMADFLAENSIITNLQQVNIGLTKQGQVRYFLGINFVQKKHVNKYQLKNDYIEQIKRMFFRNSVGKSPFTANFNKQKSKQRNQIMSATSFNKIKQYQKQKHQQNKQRSIVTNRTNYGSPARNNSNAKNPISPTRKTNYNKTNINLSNNNLEIQNQKRQSDSQQIENISTFLTPYYSKNSNLQQNNQNSVYPQSNSLSNISLNDSNLRSKNHIKTRKHQSIHYHYQLSNDKQIKQLKNRKQSYMSSISNNYNAQKLNNMYKRINQVQMQVVNNRNINGKNGAGFKFAIQGRQIISKSTYNNDKMLDSNIHENTNNNRYIKYNNSNNNNYLTNSSSSNNNSLSNINYNKNRRQYKNSIQSITSYDNDFSQCNNMNKLNNNYNQKSMIGYNQNLIKQYQEAKNPLNYHQQQEQQQYYEKQNQQEEQEQEINQIQQFQNNNYTQYNHQQNNNNPNNSNNFNNNKLLLSSHTGKNIQNNNINNNSMALKNAEFTLSKNSTFQNINFNNNKNIPFSPKNIKNYPNNINQSNSPNNSNYEKLFNHFKNLTQIPNPLISLSDALRISTKGMNTLNQLNCINQRDYSSIKNNKIQYSNQLALPDSPTLSIKQKLTPKNNQIIYPLNHKQRSQRSGSLHLPLSHQILGSNNNNFTKKKTVNKKIQLFKQRQYSQIKSIQTNYMMDFMKVLQQDQSSQNLQSKKRKSIRTSQVDQNINTRNNQLIQYSYHDNKNQKNNINNPQKIKINQFNKNIEKQKQKQKQKQGKGLFINQIKDTLNKFSPNKMNRNTNELSYSQQYNSVKNNSNKNRVYNNDNKINLISKQIYSQCLSASKHNSNFIINEQKKSGNFKNNLSQQKQIIQNPAIHNFDNNKFNNTLYSNNQFNNLQIKSKSQQYNNQSRQLPMEIKKNTQNNFYINHNRTSNCQYENQHHSKSKNHRKYLQNKQNIHNLQNLCEFQQEQGKLQNRIKNAIENSKKVILKFKQKNQISVIIQNSNTPLMKC